MCPLCTVAVAGGLGLSRWLGIDDTISGIWVGGIIISSSFWFINWLTAKKPKWNVDSYQLVIVLAFYILVLGPLYYYDIIGHPFNTIFGIDKLIFGTALGSLGFLGGSWIDKKVRKAKGKQLFNYQKVVFPVGTLAILSLGLYFLLPYLATISF
jgi:hypothetical protein